MAGLRRRTHYRKHLTDSVLFDSPEPGPSERIAKVVATRGSNQFDILIAAAGGGSADNDRRDPQLAILPTKFRKLVWVKRNDYVIVKTAVASCSENNRSREQDAKDQEEITGGGIRFMISHILYKDQVKHLKSQGLWPENDTEFMSEAAEPDPPAENDEDDDDYSDTEDDDGIVYGDDDELFVNTNRVVALKIEDSSSESEDDG